jgi:hypothetical protein
MKSLVYFQIGFIPFRVRGTSIVKMQSVVFIKKIRLSAHGFNGLYTHETKRTKEYFRNRHSCTIDRFTHAINIFYYIFFLYVREAACH